MVRLIIPPITRGLAVALAAAGFAGCNASAAGMAADGAVCQPFKAASNAPNNTAPAPSAAAPADPSVALDDCLHRWGYALAHSTDEASAVATAVSAACGSSLSRWNQAALTGGLSPGDQSAPSLITGQPTTPFNEHFQFAQGRALFYVVQARAGRCAAPPMKDGVPTGLLS